MPGIPQTTGPGWAGTRRNGEAEDGEGVETLWRARLVLLAATASAIARLFLPNAGGKNHLRVMRTQA